MIHVKIQTEGNNGPPRSVPPKIQTEGNGPPRSVRSLHAGGTLHRLATAPARSGGHAPRRGIGAVDATRARHSRRARPVCSASKHLWAPIPRPLARFSLSCAGEYYDFVGMLFASTRRYEEAHAFLCPSCSGGRCFGLRRRSPISATAHALTLQSGWAKLPGRRWLQHLLLRPCGRGWLLVLVHLESVLVRCWRGQAWPRCDVAGRERSAQRGCRHAGPTVCGR